MTVDKPSVREGPELPYDYQNHCAVLVKDEVFILGGQSPENVNLAQKMIVAIDVNSFKVIYKGEWNHARKMHSCALITGNQIVVAGGFFGGGIPFSSTEIYSVEDGTWQQGIHHEQPIN